MPSYLCISVRFPDGTFHGRRDAGEPEWPPSPLRLYQALLATGATKWRDSSFDSVLRPALCWLEQQSPPIVVAPPVRIGAPYRLSVPNNAMDIVARAWARGNLDGDGDANPATHKAMKTVRPARLICSNAVYYLWELPSVAENEVLGYVETITIAARGLIALGWGIDLVAGDGSVISESDVSQLVGERWSPVTGTSETALRVPRQGSFDALVERHRAFLNRLPSGGGFSPVPPLSTFRVVNYLNSAEPPVRQFAAFQLLRPDASAMRSYNTVRDSRKVIGMMRDATRRAAQASGWSDDRINRFILGHGEERGASHAHVGNKRFAFLPIPSIEPRGAGKAQVVTRIRRVLLTCLADGHEQDLAWASRALSGMDFIDESTKAPSAILSMIPTSDNVLRSYIRPQGSPLWASVTPVVLPGFDDRRQTKAEELLRRAIVQAGFSETLAKHAEIEFRNVGYWAGLEVARAYTVPDYLKNFPRYHVQIQWRNPIGEAVNVRGPICIGGGRFLGLGLLAAKEN